MVFFVFMTEVKRQRLRSSLISRCPPEDVASSRAVQLAVHPYFTHLTENPNSLGLLIYPKAMLLLVRYHTRALPGAIPSSLSSLLQKKANFIILP
ncbi:hypothetical protein SAMN05720766_102135 [Fibrobacter sp. UWH9]|nr:hypothetical protein SAMN05720766_102135 [Fibrobacter sp. UWH9]